jgi:hypothetical protein
MRNLRQRLDLEALWRGDRDFIASLNDEALAAARDMAAAYGHRQAEAAILDEIQKRREAIAQEAA